MLKRTYPTKFSSSHFQGFMITILADICFIHCLYTFSFGEVVKIVKGTVFLMGGGPVLYCISTNNHVSSIRFSPLWESCLKPSAEKYAYSSFSVCKIVGLPSRRRSDMSQKRNTVFPNKYLKMICIGRKSQTCQSQVVLSQEHHQGRPEFLLTRSIKMYYTPLPLRVVPCHIPVE
jgi:hypothetical protein